MITIQQYKLSNKCWVVILFAQLLMGCPFGNNEKKIKEAKDSIPFSKNIIKPSATYSDTLFINKKAAVFYNPDSIQMEKIKQINKEMVFKSMEHECFFQQRNSKIILKKYWPKISIIENTHARYLVFLKADQKRVIIDLNTKNDICGIFLFEKDKEPILVDMTNIDTELGFYFKKQL